MRAVLPLLLVSLSACGGNPPCTECPDIRGEFRMVLEAVPPEKSSCRRYYSEGGELDVVVQQNGSEIFLQPMGWKGTLYENLSLRFDAFDGETEDGHATREHVKGRISLEPSVSFTGTLTGQIPSQSCALVVPLTWQ